MRRVRSDLARPQLASIPAIQGGPTSTRITPVFLIAVATPMDVMSITSPSPSDSSVLPLSPGRWLLDTNHSSVGFTIRHLGVSKVRGRFGRFDVEVDVGASLDESSLSATIDLASIDTGNTDRDAHVLSPDLLDVARRPTMSFRSTRISGVGDDWAVEGDVTIGDVTQQLVLTVDFGGIEAFPGGGPRHAGFEATGEIRRKAFGIDIAMPPGVSGAMLGDVVKFELDIQLLEPSAD
jgi:polyisoprenoid-binding protein YceI